MKLVVKNKPMIPMIVMEFIFLPNCKQRPRLLTELESHAHPTKSRTFV